MGIIFVFFWNSEFSHDLGKKKTLTDLPANLSIYHLVQPPAWTAKSALYGLQPKRTSLTWIWGLLWCMFDTSPFVNLWGEYEAWPSDRCYPDVTWWCLGMPLLLSIYRVFDLHQNKDSWPNLIIGWLVVASAQITTINNSDWFIDECSGSTMKDIFRCWHE